MIDLNIGSEFACDLIINISINYEISKS